MTKPVLPGFTFAGDADLDAADLELPPPSHLDPADGTRLIDGLPRDDGVASPVQFIAARGREGTSTVARDVALIAVRDRGMAVALLDFNPPGDHHANWFAEHLGLDRDDGLPPSVGTDWSDDMAHFAIALSLRQVGASPLHVNARMLPPLPSGTYWRAVFGVMAQCFDLVIVDSPAAERSSDGVMLARQMARTVIVVAAETTRADLVRDLRDRIKEIGGNIAGVVLNKRRNHIPAAIDRML